MKNKIIISIFILIILFAIIISPEKYIAVSYNAILVWSKILLPALFPFFVFTKLLTSLGVVEKLSSNFKNISYKLYKTKPISSYIFCMSILTGYPVGSKLTYDLYCNGNLSKEDAKKCVTFTSNSGPMFIVGTVGIGMLNNNICGYIILASHIIGSLLNGLLYRNVKTDENYTKNDKNIVKNGNFSLSNSILDSISSILLIGGIMVIAFIIIEIIENLNLFFPLIKLLEKCRISSQISSSFLGGIFEMTKGCLSISSTTISLRLKTILCCSILTFGGISTSLQAMAFLKEICSYKFFIKQKITHMLLSTCICVMLCFLFSI